MDATSRQTATICGVEFVLDVNIEKKGHISSVELSYATPSIPRSAKVCVQFNFHLSYFLLTLNVQANALIARMLRLGAVCACGFVCATTKKNT